MYKRQAGSIAIDETHFPDKVFREQIIAEFDKDGDSVLSVDEISKAQFLNLHGMKTISSLEGIQYLTNLQSLDVSTTSVSDLSPVKNSSLKRLDCRSSKVGSVDLTRYPNLEAFLCDNTSINKMCIRDSFFSLHFDICFIIIFIQQHIDNLASFSH